MSVVEVRRAGAVATVALVRPERRNALDLPTRQALLAALEEVAADGDVRAVVLTGTDGAFCAGQDLAAREELVDAGATVADSYNPLARALRDMPKPVVAAVTGPAVGAGMGLALACDIVLLSERAVMACVFVKVGLVPDTGVTHELVARVGRARAFEIAATARPIAADEAVALGLANAVHPAASVFEAAQLLAAELAAGPAFALALTKRLLTAAEVTEPDRMLDLEARAQGAAAATAEHAEGVAAFGEKRPPRYPTVAVNDLALP